jgi:large subunit ribosomal protein L2
MDIVYDPNRSANLALVAKGEDKRYIIATENMKKGGLIKSSSKIPRMAGETMIQILAPNAL